MEKFKVSDDFAVYEAETANAAAEAGQAEKMVMGIPMPVGTVGKASILGMEAGKSKIKTDPKTKQQTGGHPMITISCLIDSPENYVGQKVSLYFTLHASGTQTVANKYQRLYDTLEDMGMPKELRGKALQEIAKWAFGETRTFNYEVVPHWQNPATEREFKARGAGGAKLPTLADLETTKPAQTLTINDQVTVAGNPCTVVEVGLPNDMVNVKFANGQVMPVTVSNVVKA